MMAGRITRRRLLVGGLAGVAALPVTAGAGVTWLWFTTPVDTVGKVTFDQPLAIPSLADAERDSDGRLVFELTATAGTSLLIPGGESTSWGFNGTYLGPTLRASRGERVVVNVHNRLPEGTTVHWHGMHLPARFDGGPHQLIEPDQTWSPAWIIDQAAATLWYHPHPHGRTRDHVNRGLAGMFIIDEPDNRAAAALPHDYGVDDIPVIVQDRAFDRSGSLQVGENFGDTILVNGTRRPHLEVTTEAVRLRLLNASAARVYDFRFSDDREFTVIASDGGLLPAPVSRRRLLLSPAERAEIVVRMAPGDRPILRSESPDLGEGWFRGMFEGARDRFDVLELRAAPRLVPSLDIPAALATPPGLAPDPVEVDRRFELQGRRINGESMDLGRIDEVVEVDTIEVWEVVNSDGDYHNLHIHDVQFEVVDVDGAPPPPELAGWKDTIFLPPGGRVRLAMRFSDYTDPDLPYMYHCHRLRHEDRGMMGQFVVVEPGQAPGAPPTYHDH